VDPDAAVHTDKLKRAQRLEEQVGKLVGGVQATRIRAADANIQELGEPICTLGHHRVQLDLDDLHVVDPQAFEKLHGRLFGDPAFGHVLLVVRPEILIHPALALCARGHLDAGDLRSP